MFKRLVLAAFVLLLAVPASARIDQRQAGDGTARWVGRAGDTGLCVGGAVLEYPNFDTASIATMYRVNPMTNAVIKDVYATSIGANTGTTTLEIWTGDNLSTISAITFAHRSTGMTDVITTAVIYLGANGAGTVFNISSVAQIANGISPSQVYKTHYGDLGGIDRGETVVVVGDGGGTGNISAVVTVVLCPR